MQPTARFRKDHQELTAIADKISALMAQDTARNGEPIRSLLSSFSGLLKMHLAAEDRALYPRLVEHKDAGVKALAARYMNEMGGLRTVFDSYVEKWPSPASIQQKADAFRAETTAVLQAIRKRIDRENSELYTRVDSLG